MMARKICALLIVLAFLGAFTFEVWAEGDEDTEFDARIEMGFHHTIDVDHPGKVGEYKVLENAAGPDVDFSATAQGQSFYLDMGGSYYEDNEHEYHFRGDYGRILDQSASYDRFQHWLDHDPLENLAAHAGSPPAMPSVTHEDLDADRDYIIIRSEEKSDTVLNLPFLPGAKINYNYRRQMREGHRQALTISHCSGCHVTNNGREVNEETEDHKIGTSMNFGWLNFAYSYFHRAFQEDGATPTNHYDYAGDINVAHIPRVQYHDDTLPYNLVPDSTKVSHLVKARASLPGNTSFFGSYVHSRVENNNDNPEVPTTDRRDMDSDTITGRLSKNDLLPGLNLSLKYRYLSLDNEDVDVDVNYQGWPAGVDPDFTRESAMSRDVTTAGLDARYQLAKRTSLGLGYEWEQIDRKNYEVDEDGETKTEANTAKVFLNTRPHRKVKARIAYTWQAIDNPFNNLYAACEPANAAAGILYSARQDSRTATLSNQPTDVNEIDADVGWFIKPNLSLTLNYRYADKENNETDYSDWQQVSHVPSLSLSYAPMARLTFNLSYIYDWTKTETLTCIPVFNG